MNIPVHWAYPAVFIGVCGHASSEFFARLTGVAGPEVSVWRYVIGAIGLLVWSLSRADSRDLLTPLREDWRSLILRCPCSVSPPLTCSFTGRSTLPA
jgi:hypothetical protein